MAGIAVVIIMSAMKSANVVPSKSGGGRYSSRARTVGRPSTVITCPSSMVQSGSSVWPFFHVMSSSTMVRPPRRPCQLMAMPATQPALMVRESITTSAVVLAYLPVRSQSTDREHPPDESSDRDRQLRGAAHGAGVDQLHAVLVDL